MTRRAIIEVHSIDYVPHAERHGKVRDLWPVWFAGDANLATVAVGVIGIALGGTMFWTALAVIGGCALGTFFMAFHSTQGPQLGSPTTDPVAAAIWLPGRAPCLGRRHWSPTSATTPSTACSRRRRYAPVARRECARRPTAPIDFPGFPARGACAMAVCWLRLDPPSCNASFAYFMLTAARRVFTLAGAVADSRCRPG